MRRWTFRLLSVLVILIALAYAGIWVIQIYPRHGSHPPLKLAKGTLTIEHARIYVSPSDPPIDKACELVYGGKSVPRVLREQIKNWDTLDAYTRYLAAKGLDRL